MELSKLIVTVIGFGLIGFIYWFFFGNKDDGNAGVVENGVVNITVDGGYKPSIIRVRVGKKVVVNFLRKDPNSCLEEVIISDLKIKKYLPMGEDIRVEFTPERKGILPFQCGMGMFHGKIIVE